MAKSSINPELERVMSMLLKGIKDFTTMPVDETCKILDRAIEIEKIKAKTEDGDNFGSGFK